MKTTKDTKFREKCFPFVLFVFFVVNPFYHARLIS
jgi:hypothetical protein